MPKRSDTTAAIAARRQTSDQMVRRVVETIGQMRAERVTITVAAVAARAEVSRTFLYENTQARTAVAAATHSRTSQRPTGNLFTDGNGSWQARALNAEGTLKKAYDEIRQQRQHIGELLGRIRDLEGDLPSDAVQRLISDNTSLRQEVHTLHQSTSDLQHRLAAARENVRFQDRAIAALQAEILELKGLSPAVPSRPGEQRRL